MKFPRQITCLLSALLAVAFGAQKPAFGQIFDDKPYAYLLLDQLEYAPRPAERPVLLEALGWIGGDINRMWLRAEAEQSTLEGVDGEGEAEVDALYGRLLTPYFDAVAGLRLEARWGERSARRGLLAVGVQGLAPYMFEIEPTLFLSQDGDLSAEFTASYHVYFTQRLILEPEAEVRAALQDVPGWDVGSGLNDVVLALRMRYEIWRKFAPYVGYRWTRTFGETADLYRRNGAATNYGTFVVGLRLWR